MNIHVSGARVPVHEETIRDALGGSETAKAPGATLYVFPTPETRVWTELDHKMGHKTIAYWIGNDVRFAKRYSVGGPAMPTYDLNLVCHQRLLTDLEEIGIEAKVLPFLARQTLCAVTLHAEPKVVVYMPTDKGKYRTADCLEIARRCPHVEFLFYGIKGDPMWLKEKPENAVAYAWMTPSRATNAIAEATILLRWTDHDGFPQNIIEAKMMGKQVIASYPYEGCIHAKDVEEVISLITDPHTHVKDESAWPSWYRTTCSPDAFRQQFERLVHGYV